MDDYMCCVLNQHGWQNRSGRPSDHQTNVCCIVPEKPADGISGPKFLKFFRTSFVLLHSVRPQKSPLL